MKCVPHILSVTPNKRKYTTLSHSDGQVFTLVHRKVWLRGFLGQWVVMVKKKK